VGGRRRLRACTELDIVPRFEEMAASNDAEMQATVVSINLHRRHLDINQRALIAARLCKTGLGANQRTVGAYPSSSSLRT
jgi:hypothetical protein